MPVYLTTVHKIKTVAFDYAAKYVGARESNMSQDRTSCIYSVRLYSNNNIGRSFSAKVVLFTDKGIQFQKNKNTLLLCCP